MNEIEKFIGEVRADPRWASNAAAMEEAFEALHREGDDNADAVELFDANPVDCSAAAFHR
jgi:hypothetical protein